MYRCVIFSAFILPASMVDKNQPYKLGEGATPEAAMDACVRKFYPAGQTVLEGTKPTWQPSTHLVFAYGSPVGTVFPVMPHLLAHCEKPATIPINVTHWPDL